MYNIELVVVIKIKITESYDVNWEKQAKGDWMIKKLLSQMSWETIQRHFFFNFKFLKPPSINCHLTSRLNAKNRYPHLLSSTKYKTKDIINQLNVNSCCYKYLQLNNCCSHSGCIIFQFQILSENLHTLSVEIQNDGNKN